jgi:hypothetical protein
MTTYLYISVTLCCIDTYKTIDSLFLAGHIGPPLVIELLDVASIYSLRSHIVNKSKKENRKCTKATRESGGPSTDTIHLNDFSSASKHCIECVYTYAHRREQL